MAKAMWTIVFITLSFSANAVKLSDEGVRRVSTAEISADNRRVVYQAEKDDGFGPSLYSVPIDGGPVTRLSIATPFTRAGAFAISPDSDVVVYIADQDVDGISELYSVPIDGGSVTKLNGLLVKSGEVPSDNGTNVRISPDSNRVVYRADQDIADVNEVYSVPINGGEATKLNAPFASGIEVSFFGSDNRISISPDGSRVVYLASDDRFNTTELYSVPIAGGGVVRLDESSRSSRDFKISLDSTRVVYLGRSDGVQDQGLYSVPIAGGPITQLNAGLAVGSFVLEFWLTPDEETVLYWVRNGSRFDELYSVPLGGGTVTRVTGDLQVPLQRGTLRISPDSTRVVFKTDELVEELYSAPISGGELTKLNDSVASGQNLGRLGFQISADSRTVVYMAFQESSNTTELFSVSINGGLVTKISRAFTSGGGVNTFKMSPDGRLVVYRADHELVGVQELYSVSIAGGAVTRLNGDLPERGSLNDGQGSFFWISPDSRRVVYSGEQDMEGVTELYSVPLVSAPAAVGIPALSAIAIFVLVFGFARLGQQRLNRARQER